MIRLEHISFSYGEGFSLEDISLEVRPKELISIVGPNGSGKSTLLKLCTGQLSPKEGSVFIRDERLSQMKARQIAKEISYLSQNGLVSDLTVEEVVLHGRFPYTAFPHRYGSRDREYARMAMEQMDLLPMSQLPLSSLSGGERQKAMIAMALCQDSKAIFMDEPTAFLDPYHRLTLMEKLKSLSDGGKSVVCVLHDLPLALQFSHKIAVMEKGKSIFFGTAQEALECDALTRVFGIEIKQSNDGFYYYGKKK